MASPRALTASEAARAGSARTSEGPAAERRVSRTQRRSLTAGISGLAATQNRRLNDPASRVRSPANARDWRNVARSHDAGREKEKWWERARGSRIRRHPLLRR